MPNDKTLKFESTPPVAREGLVISYFGSSVAVEAEDGQVFQCHLHRNQDLPVVGDRVRWQLEKDDTGTILGIVSRRSQLSRGEGHGKVKPIAANIDALVIVMAPPPIFSEYLVDRYLIAAELLHIQPILVMNKSDLLVDDKAKAAALARLKPYQAIPYSVILSSALKKEGLSDLVKELEHKTVILVGPSGVGKSSIIMALGKDTIRVGDVSPKGTGKHTTTATRLYHLPYGGDLIDSPGVREFNLWPVKRDEILRGFKEFKPFLTGCRFRDCLHLAEPGCAVQEAVANGKISAQRYTNYQELMKNAHTKTYK